MPSSLSATWSRYRTRLVLLVESRPLELPSEPTVDFDFAFGRPDRIGLVGESPAIWAMRAELEQTARVDMHTLVLGPSGVSKELVAQGLYRSSRRAAGRFVSRSAATIPHTLIDAELFGNIEGYPNATMQGRPGLIGAADGGILYLDEIAELPEDAQAHFLRVLDRDGEYQRLREARVRRSELRVVAATHRSPSTLKHDLLHRFPLRLEVAGLDKRRCDIPLLVNHTIERIRDENPELYARALVERRDGPALSLDPAFIAALLMKRTWVGHVRELVAHVYAAFLEAKPEDGSKFLRGGRCARSWSANPAMTASSAPRRSALSFREMPARCWRRTTSSSPRSRRPISPRKRSSSAPRESST
jgi:two-component system nitrogen regulation response regulator GlnG/two-component system response regulator HydG